MLKDLIRQASDVEFVPHRYNGAHAFFYRSNVLTLDWDIDEDEHPAECVTVASYKEVLDILKQDVELHPTHLWEVQRTRSGYHAVLLGDCEVGEAKILDYMLSLACDPQYVENIGRKEEFSYDWRLTPKCDGDPIALPVCRVGHGSPLPQVLNLLAWYYQAVEAAKTSYSNDAMLWEEVYSELEEDEYQLVNEHLNELGAFDWWHHRVVRNPITNEEYISCMVQWDEEDWKQRYTLPVDFILDRDPARYILALLPNGWEDA